MSPDVEAVVEVLAESALADLAFEILVGRSDHADVHIDGLGGAEATDLSLLEDPQECHLEGLACVADLVEEQGALVGLLDQALPAACGAGEGLALVAEQLVHEHALGDRRAVDRDEGVATPAGRPPEVDGLGDELLACAALAEDEHGLVARGDALADSAVEGADGRALADEPREALLAVATAGWDGELVEDDPELVHVERLGQEVIGPLLARLERDVAGRDPGDDDDVEVWPDALGAPSDLEALVAARHPHVDECDVEELGGHPLEGLLAVARLGHIAAEPLEHLADGRAHLRLVVHDQDPAGVYPPRRRVLLAAHQWGSPLL